MRFENWPEMLQEQIKHAKLKSFEWGKFDCCLFAADTVYAMTGVDPVAEFRGRYSTRIGAAKLIKAAGGFEAMITAVLGPPKSILKVSRGDVVLGEVSSLEHLGPVLGVCEGGVSWFVGEEGLIAIPTKCCTKSWGIT